MPAFDQVTILGPGLLGASLAMAVRENHSVEKIIIWARRKESLMLCEGQHWCDHAENDLTKALQGSDLVVLCTPVESILSMVPEIIQLTNKNVIITDVGSVKGSICRVAEKHTKDDGGRFIGSHPMAGSEKSGMEHASVELFRGRTCILTPFTNSEKDQVDELSKFWRQIGMKVCLESYDKHDEIVSYVSHLPHILASSLGSLLSTQPDDWKRRSGKGLSDTTRIAEGDPELWCQIMKMNQGAINESLKLWIESIQGFQNNMEAGNWDMVRDYLEKGTNFRKGLE